jgi:hypothetical protein
MNDAIHRATKAIDHNWPLVLGLTVAIGIMAVGWGCKATVKSPFDDAREVSRIQLTNEVEVYVARIQGAYKELDQKEQQIEAAINYITGMVESFGGPAVAGLLGPLGGAAGLAGLAGAAFNIKKKTVVVKTRGQEIKELRAQLNALKGGPTA